MKLRIEKAIYGGAGLAHIPEDASQSGLAGKAVFVPYSLPGELVEAHLADDRKSFATAEIDSVLEISPQRIPPGCEYFPLCGGCHYQYAGPAYQLEMKRAILRDALERARLDQQPAIIGSLDSEPWGYRNRIRLHIARDQHSGAQAGAAEGFRLCYRVRSSHRNLPVTHCPIAAPILERAIAAVLRTGAKTGLPGRWTEIEFFTNSNQDTLLVSLWTDSAPGRSGKRLPPESLNHFSTTLQSELPELTGVGAFFSGEQGDRLLSHWGQPSLLYSVSGRSYQVSLGSFFQVNRFLIPGLVDLVARDPSGAVRRGRLAWDLYAGAGLFSLALNFEQITAVEAAPTSAADLRRNLAAASRRVVQSTTVDFLRREARLGSRMERPDLVLVDPPRAGLGKEVCALLAQIAAPVITYVSCDPATLARDLQTLLQSGYRIETMYLVDLFPQTFHLESVTTLTRG